MTDYGYVFSKAVHEKLKEKIRASVFVKSTADDELIIKITRNGDFEFSSTIRNFSDKIIHGYSSDYAAHEILEKYKRFVMNRYFI